VKAGQKCTPSQKGDSARGRPRTEVIRRLRTALGRIVVGCYAALEERSAWARVVPCEPAPRGSRALGSSRVSGKSLYGDGRKGADRGVRMPRAPSVSTLFVY